MADTDARATASVLQEKLADALPFALSAFQYDMTAVVYASAQKWRGVDAVTEWLRLCPQTRARLLDLPELYKTVSMPRMQTLVAAVVAIDPAELSEHGQHSWKTPLMQAVHAGRPDIVAHLLAVVGQGPDGAAAMAALASTTAPTDYKYGAHSPFSFACRFARLGVTESERSALAACALLLAPHVSPAATPLSGMTHLSSACFAGLVPVVEAWVAAVDKEVVQHRDKDGDTAFSWGCAWAHDSKWELSEADRAAAIRCVVLLASSGKVDAGGLAGEDSTNLHWASYARLPEVVTLLLSQPGCDEAVVNRRSENGHTAFSHVCQWARDPKPRLSAADRAAAARCAQLLYDSGKVDPAALGFRNGTQLLWACAAGLVGVVEAWVGTVDAAVVQQRDANGDTAFSLACYWARDSTRPLSNAEKAAAARCAQILVSSGKVDAAAVAKARAEGVLLE